MLPKQKISSAFLPLCSAKNIAIEDMVHCLESINLSPQECATLTNPDPLKPYGRKVLINHPNLEVMLATWNPNWRCAPHDHGGSLSAILVLQGCSSHWGYHIYNSKLEITFQEYKKEGEVLICDPDQIHSMASCSQEKMLTLHCYAKAIDHMILYDENLQESLMVDGGCGAWLPVDNIEDIQMRKVGFWTRKQFFPTSSSISSQNYSNPPSL